MQGFLNAWVAGPCSVLPPSFPLEKLRNLLGSLPGAGSLLLAPLWEGRFPLGLLVLPAGEARKIWMCSDLDVPNAGLLRESHVSEFKESHDFQMKGGLDWAISIKPSHKL